MLTRLRRAPWHNPISRPCRAPWPYRKPHMYLVISWTIFATTLESAYTDEATAREIAESIVTENDGYHTAVIGPLPIVATFGQDQH